jgi:cytochrome oxidase Cu insertion factor (SCO1/SenC/PrrC family)
MHSTPAPAAPPFRRLLAIGVVGLVLSLIGIYFVRTRLAPVAAGAGTGGSALSVAADSPEAFARVQPFRLTERSGREVDLGDLAGRPWVASFVFTRCAGPCPRISAGMQKLQGLVAGSDVRLVTYTVDPQYDTPAVLAEYARRFEADPERWLFLTGAPAEIEAVSVASFQLPFQRDESQPVGQLVTHKTLLTVVDGQGVIRGYYDGESELGVAQAAARALHLSKKP